MCLYTLENRSSPAVEVLYAVVVYEVFSKRQQRVPSSAEDSWERSETVGTLGREAFPALSR